MDMKTPTNKAANDTTFRSLDCVAAAKHLRATLKAELGVSSKDVSVRVDQYSMGSTIRVLVRSLDVRVADVAPIAQRYSSLDRDADGNVLCGGNRHVEVVREHGDVTAQLRAIALGQMKSVTDDLPIAFALSTRVAMSRGDVRLSDAEWQVWSGGECVDCVDAVVAARVAVEAYLELPRGEMAVAS
jgi:hypothetical protein